MNINFHFPPVVLTGIPARLIKAAGTTLCRFFLPSCLFLCLITKAQEVVWATSIGSPGQETVFNPIVDAKGDVYLNYYTYPNSSRLVKCNGATGKILYEKEFIGRNLVVDKNGDIWNNFGDEIEKYSGKDLSLSGVVEDRSPVKLWRNSQGNIYSLRYRDHGIEWFLSAWNLSNMREFVVTRIEVSRSSWLENVAIDHQGRSFVNLFFTKDLSINGVKYPSSPALYGSISRAVIACNPSGEKQWHMLFYNCGIGEIQGDDRGNLYMFFNVDSNSQMVTNDGKTLHIPSPAGAGHAICVIKVDGETGHIIYTEHIVTEGASVIFEHLQLHEGGIMSIGTRTFVPFSPTYSYTSGRIFLDPDNCGRRVSVNVETETGVQSLSLREKGFIYQTIPFPEGAEPSVSQTVTVFSPSTDILLVKKRNSAPELGECDKEEVQLFPNPAYNHVTISVTSTEAPYTITFSDISGKILFHAYEQDTHRFTNIEDLAPGIYFVTITSASGERNIKKFLKVR